jgi:hypothetical protein
MAQVTGTANQLTSPVWAGDFLDREHLYPGGAKVDPAQFFATDSVLVKLSAAAAIDDVAISFDALSGPIPSGTLLHFGQSKEFARTTAAAAAGATTVAVEALPAALEDDDEARYVGVGTQPKRIIAGTLVGRTFAERAAGTSFGPAADADDEVLLVAFDVTDAARNSDVELYRPGSIVKENFLPNFSSLSVALLAKLRATYATTRGAA